MPRNNSIPVETQQLSEQMGYRLLPTSRELQRKGCKDLQGRALGGPSERCGLPSRGAEAVSLSVCQSGFLWPLHAGGRGADEVLGEALTGILHPTPSPLESLCSTANDSKSECIRQP